MGQAALTVRDLSVRFGLREVLQGVSLEVAPGQVHALVGENGAGKTTLIRAASGLLAADEGEVAVDGRALSPGDAGGASRAGIGVVHQHFMLVDSLSVLDNIVLGAEPRRGPLGLRVDRGAARQRIVALCEEHHLPVDPEALVGALPVGVRQRVEILKVLFRGARVLLLDEPTAVLSPAEVSALLDTVRALAAGGAGVLFVSHKLAEVFAVAERVTVLHRGRVTLSARRGETTPDEVARAVVGGGALPESPPRRSTPSRGEVTLSLRSLQAPGLRGVSLEVRAGEVLGIAGVEGNGQRPLAECIAGVLPAQAGSVLLRGADITRDPPGARRVAGLRWVPEDRERRGLLADLTVAENLCLGDPRLATGAVGYDPGDAEALARKVIERFDVRPRDVSARVSELSGGNQQKVLVGRELSGDPVALVVAQPTRGVDLGASSRIHAAIRDVRERGAAVLLITSELDELRALCDRVVVLRAGEVAAELSVEAATDEVLGAAMLGGVA